MREIRQLLIGHDVAPIGTQYTTATTQPGCIITVCISNASGLLLTHDNPSASAKLYKLVAMNLIYPLCPVRSRSTPPPTGHRACDRSVQSRLKSTGHFRSRRQHFTSRSRRQTRPRHKGRMVPHSLHVLLLLLLLLLLACLWLIPPRQSHHTTLKHKLHQYGAFSTEDNILAEAIVHTAAATPNRSELNN